MFDIGWSEFVLIAVVALIAIGPKELPGVLRMVGQWMGKARKMAAEFQGQFQEAMREAEMADLKKSFDEVKEAASGFTGGNLMTSLRRMSATRCGSTTSTSRPWQPKRRPSTRPGRQSRRAGDVECRRAGDVETRRSGHPGACRSADPGDLHRGRCAGTRGRATGDCAGSTGASGATGHCACGI